MVDSSKIVESVRSVLPDLDFIPLHEPKFANNALTYVTECVETGWVSTAGRFVAKFEEALQVASGAKHAIAVSSGTTSLHLSLLVSKVREGDEVVCPGLSFVATANAITYVNAVPHFVDVSKDSMSVCHKHLRDYFEKNLIIEDHEAKNANTGRRVSAFLGVHAFGFSMDTRAIEKVCADFYLDFIEDAACSIGAEYEGRPVTSNSRLASMSFNGNKVITCGGGGAVLTNCADIASRVKHISTTAKKPHQWEYYHDEIGFNYRLPNINAALGLAELENLEEKLLKKRNLYKNYASAFEDLPGISLIQGHPNSKPNYWLICAKLENGGENERNNLLKQLNDAGFMSRPLWTPLNELPMFADCPSDHLKNVRDLYKSVICLPSSPQLLS